MQIDWKELFKTELAQIDPDFIASEGDVDEAVYYGLSAKDFYDKVKDGTLDQFYGKLVQDEFESVYDGPEEEFPEERFDERDIGFYY